ncbi:MAG: hypothetical protein PHE50_10520 [Dehalococcoidales bacterium]|nr:hypothetical protein [Dehalococcoidales bacterium]
MEVWGITFIVAAVIFLIGILFLIWGKREERNYYDSLTTRVDLREFFSRWPPRPQPGALKAGGWIAIFVGLALAGVGWLIIYVQSR